MSNDVESSVYESTPPFLKFDTSNNHNTQNCFGTPRVCAKSVENVVQDLPGQGGSHFGQE